jgi:hypothetical protein
VTGLRKDGWDERELLEGDAYATTCNNVIVHIVGELQSIEVILSPDKRTVVEVTALLQVAARIARERLGLSANDFADSARDVFAHQ